MGLEKLAAHKFVASAFGLAQEAHECNASGHCTVKVLKHDVIRRRALLMRWSS